METTNKPIWLLDLEGVIFVEGSKSSGGYDRLRRERIITNNGRVLRVRYAPRLAKEILNIYNSGFVDIWWATSWCDEADKVEKVLGFPYLPRAFSSCESGGFKEKQMAAKKVINKGYRLIWTDDTVTPRWGDLYDFLTAYGQGLLITPEPDKGLQPEDINRIKEFIGFGISS